MFGYCILGILMRFQRTNHGWADGIYEIRCHVSHIPEVVLRNQTVNKSGITLEQFPLTLFVSQYFYQFGQLSSLPPFYFFRVRGSLGKQMASRK